MSDAQWNAVGHTDFGQLRDARLQAHYAAQWLARAARGYIAPRPDDGHTSLGWNDSLGGLTTHPLKDETRFGLRFADLALVLVQGGRITQSFSLHGKSETDARAWLGQELQALDLPPKRLDAPLPYELPVHPVAQGGRYDTAWLAAALTELAAWYANGAAALRETRQRLLARGLRAAEVRCWPHHFDLDCLTVIGDGAAYAVPTMGAGFSPGDHYYDEPYFYISLYPRPDLVALPQQPSPGHWHTEDFVAALLPASRILAMKDRKAETAAFLNTATDEIVKLLRGLLESQMPR